MTDSALTVFRPDKAAIIIFWLQSLFMRRGVPSEPLMIASIALSSKIEMSPPAPESFEDIYSLASSLCLASLLQKVALPRQLRSDIRASVQDMRTSSSMPQTMGFLHPDDGISLLLISVRTLISCSVMPNTFKRIYWVPQNVLLYQCLSYTSFLCPIFRARITSLSSSIWQISR